MARSCLVCRHKDLDRIDQRILEGVGTQAIAEEFGVDRMSIGNHRSSGHAAKGLTRQVLNAHTGPLSDYAAITIASKLERMKRLDAHMKAIERVIQQRAEVFSKLPGGDTGLIAMRLKMIGSGDNSQVVEEAFFDKDLSTEYRAVMEQATKEAGQWKPDGGDAAAATDRLAQSIVIHASVAAKALQDKELANTIDVKPLK